MTYDETLEYLFSYLPMFQRTGAAAYRADLGNIQKLADMQGNIQNNCKHIHIAGTNGKGSTSHMIASVLQEQGYKTGLYTSPHLKDFRERIRVNGKMIPKNEVIWFVENYRDQFEIIKPSFFEWTLALAFYYFNKVNVDVTVIETGMGGRLDSTNIINPMLCVITNISYDHVQFLGDTLEKIAAEKAGIIKAKVPVVIGEKQAEIQEVFKAKAKEVKAKLYFAESLIPANHNFTTDLKGIYQSKNIRTALAALHVLQENTEFKIDEQNIRNGLNKVIENTELMGRWQKLQDEPPCYCDTGHNIEGIKLVCEQIKQQNYRKLFFVFGMIKEKDPRPIFALLPKEAEYFFCRPNIERGLGLEELESFASEFGLQGKTYYSVQDAFNAAKEKAGKYDFVFVGGSTYVVAEIL
jgi:dihydrofolate synthase/folylpolyglutamate synthase